MKFFKYLIFIITSIFSINSYCVVSPNNKFDPNYPNCGDYVKNDPTFKMYAQVQYTSTETLSQDKVRCHFKWSSSSVGSLNNNDYHDLFFRGTKCEPGTKRRLDGFITQRIEGQVVSLPEEVCFSHCIHARKSDGFSFTTPNGNDSWEFDAETTGMECDQDTPKGEDKPITPVDPNMKPEECKNANGSNAYCDKPTDKNCPTGYKQGMFNNKQICIKDSDNPDPNKPNPNDPNNGDGKGEGNCNGTNNCNTTEFDDSKIIAAINASTSAISNAIASLSNTITNGLNSLASSINSVSSAINANTNAVNANGEKVTSAVNAGTNVIKENGKKLDGIKDEISKGNGFLKDIKDWLFGDVPEDPKHEIPTSKLNEKSFLTNLIVVNASYCPQDKVINWSTPVGTLNKTVSFQNFCDATSWFGYLVLAASYYLGAMIVIRDS